MKCHVMVGTKVVKWKQLAQTRKVFLHMREVKVSLLRKSCSESWYGIVGLYGAFTPAMDPISEVQIIREERKGLSNVPSTA